MEDRKLTERLSVAVDADLLRYIDAWRRKHTDLPSRSKAARLMIEETLKAHGIPTTNPPASFVHAAPPATKSKAPPTERVQFKRESGLLKPKAPAKRKGKTGTD